MSYPQPTHIESRDALSAEEITELRRFTSPTIANVIETFDVRPRGEGVTGGGVCCVFPEFGAMVGCACTATILSGQPASAKRLISRSAYWEYVRRAPQPKIIVVQDLSDVPGGAYWGEVNANMHLALGAAGVITNGTVRDVDEVRGTGFHFFASGISVSHGFAHLEDFNRPVKLFGMMVQPGDLIHADGHGAVIIPAAIAHEVAAAARELERSERIIINLCRSAEFSIEALDKLISPEY